MELLSVVIPVFNEESVISETLTSVLALRSGLLADDICLEVIVVDDGSTDRTAALLKQWRSSESAIHVVSLSRNFGHQAALMAGYEVARGDAVLTMDGDGQHPAELIMSMVALWQAGWPVIATRRLEQRNLGWAERRLSSGFYWLFNASSAHGIIPGSSDFRLIDRQVLDVLRESKSHSMFYRGLVPWLGFPTTTIEFDQGKRMGGTPSYTLRKSILLALAGIATYTRLPLIAVLFAISALLVVMMAYAGFVIFQRFVVDGMVPGQASILILMMATSAVQLVTLGAVLLYAYRAFREVAKQPLFVIKEHLE